MLRPFSKITIQQVPSGAYANRNRKIVLDVVANYEITSGWEDHTDTAHVVLPKNIVLLDENKPLFSTSGTALVVLGGVNEDVSPLVMKGDSITIVDGYYFFNRQGTQEMISEQKFQGFVSKVHARIPIELECEDNFYLLKQTPIGNTPLSGNLLSLCKTLIGLVNSQYSDKSKYPTLSIAQPDELTAGFSLGFIDKDNDRVTVSKVFDTLRTQYHIESAFIGDKLVLGFPIYNEATANSKNIFEFQNNILSHHSLEYVNQDDVTLSAVVNTITQSSSGSTKDGQPVTQQTRGSMLIYWDSKKKDYAYKKKAKGEAFPPNDEGERHEFYYNAAPGKAVSDADLFAWGKQQLQKYAYTGFRGSFTTFGYPLVRWNDNVNLVSRVMADHNGQYKVKKVIYSGGVDGCRQEIFLDYKQAAGVPENYTELYMI